MNSIRQIIRKKPKTPKQLREDWAKKSIKKQIKSINGFLEKLDILDDKEESEWSKGMRRHYNEQMSLLKRMQ